MARVERAELHPVHVGHDRQAERRAARHRRLRGRACQRRCATSSAANRARRIFSTSDIGWVVGHSLHRLRTAAERHGNGDVRRPADPPRWRHLVEHRREVQGQRDVLVADRDPRAEEAGSGVAEESTICRVCACLFLAGEPLDETTARWIADGIGKPVIDNYWQTETGWPILGIPRNVEALPSKFGSPGVRGRRVRGQDLRRIDRRGDQQRRIRKASSRSKVRCHQAA